MCRGIQAQTNEADNIPNVLRTRRLPVDPGASGARLQNYLEGKVITLIINPYLYSYIIVNFQHFSKLPCYAL